MDALCSHKFIFIFLVDIFDHQNWNKMHAQMITKLSTQKTACKMQTNASQNMQCNFISHNNQMNAFCMHFACIWSIVFQRKEGNSKSIFLLLEIHNCVSKEYNKYIYELLLLL